jgi:hypothetical protein
VPSVHAPPVTHAIHIQCVSYREGCLLYTHSLSCKVHRTHTYRGYHTGRGVYANHGHRLTLTLTLTHASLAAGVIASARARRSLSTASDTCQFHPSSAVHAHPSPCKLCNASTVCISQGGVPAQHSTAWHGMAQHGMAWHSMAWHGMAQHSTAWHGMAWHGTAWHGTAMAQHSMAQHGMGTADSPALSRARSHACSAAAAGHTPPSL